MKKMTFASLLAAARVFVSVGRTETVKTTSNPFETPMLALKPRAVAGTVRAEVASDVKALFDQLNGAVTAMRTQNDERLGKIEAKVDPLDIQQFERINSTIDKLELAIEEQARKIEAAKLNGDAKPAPRDPEYTSQFNAYFSKGVSSQKLEEVRAAATKTDGEGGYLAPVEWDRSLTTKLKQVSKMRQYASVQRIGGAGFSKAFSDGVIGSGWVGETAARPATTTPGLTSLAFPLGELYANPAASQGLIDDAEVDIEDWLGGEVTMEFDRQEGIAFLAGDGTNKPHGVLTYVAGAANAARHPWGAIQVVNSGDATKVTADGILSLIYALPEEFETNANLFLNRSSMGAIRKLKDGQNNYLWQPSFEAGQPSSIAGVPIAHIPGMPSIAADAVAALYGDMQATYQIVDRIGVRVLRDPYMNKPFVHFYTTKRVGGGVKNPEPMRALKIAA